MTLRWFLWFAAARLCLAETAPALEQRLLRVAEEAEAFASLAPKVIGHEVLEQVAAQAPPRFQPRGIKPALPFKSRQIVSEYGFAAFKDDPENLHEIRHVLTVDGHEVKEPGKLRETLSMGLDTDADKQKKKLLKEFESYGLRQAATDFGQVILLFTKRQLPNYTFRILRREYLGPEPAIVVSFEQKEGASAMTVFEGKHVVRHKLQGELWLRDTDGLPLRIVLLAGRVEKDIPLRHFAVVDYQRSAHGLVLPAVVTYSESVNGQVLVQNRFHYSDFKMFGANSELKFTVEETPKK